MLMALASSSERDFCAHPMFCANPNLSLSQISQGFLTILTIFLSGSSMFYHNRFISNLYQKKWQMNRAYMGEVGLLCNELINSDKVYTEN